MIIKMLIFLILFFPFIHLKANSPQLLDFQQLNNYFEDVQKGKNSLSSPHLKEIIIRGFLYRMDSETYILAAEPNLKSCCLNKISPGKQIQIQENLFLKRAKHTNGPVLIQGILQVNRDENKNSSTFFFSLQNAYLLEETKKNQVLYVFLMAGIICLLTTTLFFFTKKKKL